MPRFALKIDYDGGPFSGWQRQANAPSVQSAIEAALARLDPAAPQITGAGRTDAGVHATGQVAHADLARDWDPFRLAGALNAHLRPAPIAILAAARVADDFHARFSAMERRYLYRLVQRRAPLTHDRGRAWQVLNPLDPGADEVRIEMAAVPGGWEFRFHLRARSFLHNQVRSIVGTLERVGAGAWSPGDVARALAARDRAACGPVCPPQGLYLVGVSYPEDPFPGS